MGAEQIIVIVITSIVIGIIMKFVKKAFKTILSVAIGIISLIYVGYISMDDVKSIGDMLLQFIQK